MIVLCISRRVWVAWCILYSWQVSVATFGHGCFHCAGREMTSIDEKSFNYKWFTQSHEPHHIMIDNILSSFFPSCKSDVSNALFPCLLITKMLCSRARQDFQSCGEIIMHHVVKPGLCKTPFTKPTLQPCTCQWVPLVRPIAHACQSYFSAHLFY